MTPCLRRGAGEGMHQILGLTHGRSHSICTMKDDGELGGRVCGGAACALLQCPPMGSAAAHEAPMKGHETL